jgi:hypothetical protein
VVVRADEDRVAVGRGALEGGGAEVLPAPAMFSMATGLPSAGATASARMRATMSAAPATATGTTRRAGRSG